MPINMGDQFKGLPMGDLIGGPLMAACDAQVRLANATAAFIQQIGFRPKTSTAVDPSNPDAVVPFNPGDMEVRTVQFKFTRPAANQTVDGKPSPTILTEDVSLEVPLLAIVKIPSLAISTVDITFDMEVKNSERTSEIDESKGSFSADASVGWGPFSLRVHVEGSVSTHKENTRQTDQSAKYHVEVRAEDKGMPEGLARVLDLMNTAIAPKTIGPSEPAKPADPLQAPALNTRQDERGTFVTDNDGLDHEPGAEAAATFAPGTYRIEPVPA